MVTTKDPCTCDDSFYYCPACRHRENVAATNAAAKAWDKAQAGSEFALKSYSQLRQGRPSLGFSNTFQEAAQEAQEARREAIKKALQEAAQRPLAPWKREYMGTSRATPTPSRLDDFLPMPAPWKATCYAERLKLPSASAREGVGATAEQAKAEALKETRKLVASRREWPTCSVSGVQLALATGSIRPYRQHRHKGIHEVNVPRKDHVRLETTVSHYARWTCSECDK